MLWNKRRGAGKGCWERAVGVRLGDLTEKREPKLGGLGKGSGSRRSCKEPNPEGELRGVSKNREAREFDSIRPQSLLQALFLTQSVMRSQPIM